MPREISESERIFQEHVSRLFIANDPTLTAIGRVVCINAGTIWPDQLVGYERAGEAAHRSGERLSRVQFEPSRLQHVVRGRRIAWYLAGALTDETPEAVGDAFGGHNPDYVARFMNGVDRLHAHYPEDKTLTRRLVELAMMVQVELEVPDFTR